MQDRGLAAYIAELIGTFFLVFVIGTVITLYVAAGGSAQFGSDFAVVGFTQGLVLFALIMAFGAVSGGHFNPAVTVAAAALRRIDPIDAIVYILAQLSGAVLGALAVKGMLLDEGRAVNWGAADVSPLLGSDFAGMIGEGIGALLIVLGVVAVAMNKRARNEWGPLTIGLTFAFCVFIFGPLTGGSFNPARWFGPALVSNEWGGVWPYIVGPLLGGLIAVAIYKLVISAGETEPELEKATGPSTGTTARPQK
ncbi:MAG TPA: aquaporin [Solirubrobacterales bacterium]|nr:aquaporin [Solirubrobacterales bacterium]